MFGRGIELGAAETFIMYQIQLLSHLVEQFRFLHLDTLNRSESVALIGAFPNLRTLYLDEHCNLPNGDEL